MIVNERVEDYMRRLTGRYDEPVLRSMEELAASEGFPIVGRLCGITIELMARAIGATRVFELGSGFGFSAYWFGRAVGRGGEVHLTDADDANQQLAADFLSRAGLWDRVSYHVGDAIGEFVKVGGDFDIVYCDIDKEGYPDAWRAARDRIRPGGMWICDNTLWRGQVAEPDPDATTRAILEHNRLVTEDPEFVTSIVPTRDGLMVALRVG